MTAHNFMGKNKPYPINSTNICNATTRPINQMGEEKGQKFFRKKNQGSQTNGDSFELKEN